jgi:hypothetical protein
MIRRLHRVQDELLLAICCIVLWALQMHRPLTGDVAWLLDAGSRWFHGQRLYVDIVELNPPLIFYDMALLTAGTWSKAAYLAGVCTAIFVSCLWCERRWIAFAALSLPALEPFGQRDHLALIAVLPYLVADRPTWRMGVWMFTGAALKPHLLLIPLGAAMWRRRLDPALVVLGGLVAAYAVFIALVHPVYLTEIVPLARATYGGLGGSVGYHIYQIGLIIAVGAMSWRSPLAGAIIGALLSYLLQGKFWYYQLVPAAGLAIYLALAADGWKNVNRACAAALAILSVAIVARAGRPVDPVPAGAKRVLFLTAHIPVAYPVVFERGVENTSPYPALWPLPGAGNRRDILDEVRRRQVDAIVERCPQYIFTNRGDPFDYLGFLASDPRFHGYSMAGSRYSFRIYRNPECG